jgi:hypothetical protein
VLEEHVGSIFRPKNKPSSSASYLLYNVFLLGLFFEPEDGSDMFFHSVG